ncbi:hypothetical protein EIP86_008994 [Pleurotus ostreatoroseus]|nr:hypothetical protein EIP86_008994 [Pleurotus ostreatoroseus]
MSRTHSKLLAGYTLYGHPSSTPNTSDPLNGVTLGASGGNLNLRRRSREDEDETTPEGRTRKKHRTFSRKLAQNHGVDVEELYDFVDLDEQMQRLQHYAVTLSLSTKKVLAENTRWLLSKEGKKVIEGQCLLILLSPYLSNYLEGLTKYTLEHACKHPHILRLPVGLVDEPDLRKILNSTISTALTKGRGKLRYYLLASIVREESIDVSLSKIAPPTTGLQISVNHWLRWAWLRSVIVFFAEQTKKNPVKAKLSATKKKNSTASRTKKATPRPRQRRTTPASPTGSTPQPHDSPDDEEEPHDDNDVIPSDDEETPSPDGPEEQSPPESFGNSEELGPDLTDKEPEDIDAVIENDPLYNSTDFWGCVDDMLNSQRKELKAQARDDDHLQELWTQ